MMGGQQSSNADLGNVVIRDGVGMHFGNRNRLSSAGTSVCAGRSLVVDLSQDPAEGPLPYLRRAKFFFSNPPSFTFLQSGSVKGMDVSGNVLFAVERSR